MLLYPKDLYNQLEFHKIQELLSAHCLGGPAIKVIMGLRLFERIDKLRELMVEVQEFQKIKAMAKDFPLHHYQTVNDHVRLLRTIDIVLEKEAYLELASHLNLVNGIVYFFSNKENRKEFPVLGKIVEDIDIDQELIKSFSKIFDEEGNVKPTASSTLSEIMKAISSKERELEKLFSRILIGHKQRGYLTESEQSYKNGRRVLSVLAEHKRKIKGIIHDESATGRTVFIEPEELVELNNQLFEFAARKKHEIYKILKDLGNQLRPYLDDFLRWQRIIVRYDIIRAKTNFAETYGGRFPELSEDKTLKYVKMYHPLLKILNDRSSDKTIPFDLELDTSNRMLVISGPNGGGKSVALKAVGLNQLMLQSGIPVPVGDGSCFTIFRKIMIDIGDQQSIEGDLSTYTSRLLHMKAFTERADKNTLILIDEFGSGSDPKMGGAIAESVLKELVKKKNFGVITTHYSNIKDFAYRSEVILNGAMLFNKDTHQPSYILKVGQPGSSFAFEIAEKIGLGKRVLDYAKNKAGKESKTVDKLLIDLQHEKKVLEDELLSAYDERHRLEKLIKNYDEMKSNLEVRRKRLKLASKEKEHFEVSKYEKELQDLIKSLKKERSLEKTKAAAEELKKLRESSRQQINSISEQVFKTEIEQVKDLELGQFVKFRNGSEAGKVIDIGQKKVRLEIGNMQFEVPRNEIILSNSPIAIKPKSINMDTLVNPYDVESELDIRGYSKAEAMEAIQEFLDNALMSNSVNQLKILHGKGTGVLKRTLWQQAKEYKDIKKIWHPEQEFGGAGVTFISFT